MYRCTEIKQLEYFFLETCKQVTMVADSAMTTATVDMTNVISVTDINMISNGFECIDECSCVLRPVMQLAQNLILIESKCLSTLGIFGL